MNRYQFTFISIIIFGAFLRILFNLIFYTEPSDVIQYIHTARFLLGEETYYGDPREIGYPLVLATFGLIFGISYNTARFLTIFLGIINIFLIKILTKRVLDRWSYFKENQEEIALFTCFLVAISPTIIRSDVLGLREPLAGLLLIICVILLYSPKGFGERRISKELDLALLFFFWFYLSITRSEFVIVGPGLACFVALEGWQFAEKRTKLKAALIVCASIIAFFFWNIFSYNVFDNSSATADMLVDAIILRNDPDVIPQGLIWYIFDYLGLFRFIFMEIYGTSQLISSLVQFTSIYLFVFIVIGGFTMLKRSHLLIPAIFLLLAIINGFNAYAWEFIGSDRILSISFPFIFILSSITYGQINDFKFRLSPERVINIPGIVSKVTLILILTLNALLRLFLG